MESEPFTNSQPLKMPLGSAGGLPWIATLAKSDVGVGGVTPSWVTLVPLTVSMKTRPFGIVLLASKTTVPWR